MADPAKLVLIDGHALVYRAYFALPSTMATAQGELTNAVFGFASMLLNVLRDEQPDYLAVTFDLGRTFRHDDYAEYKANRAEMPDDLRMQFQRIDELLEAFDIPTYSAEGYEADDVLAALAQQAEAEGVDTLIVTGDTDTFQLVGPHVRVLAPRRSFGDTADLRRGWHPRALRAGAQAVDRLQGPGRRHQRQRARRPRRRRQDGDQAAAGVWQRRGHLRAPGRDQQRPLPQRPGRGPRRCLSQQAPGDHRHRCAGEPRPGGLPRQDESTASRLSSSSANWSSAACWTA